MAKNVAGNKKGSCRYISSEKKITGNMGQQIDGTRDLVTKNKEKLKYLMYSSPWSLLVQHALSNCRSVGHAEKSGARKTYSLLQKEEDHIREHLKLDIYNSM